MLKCLRYSCFLGFLLILPIGLVLRSYNVILISIISLLINNILFSLERINERIVFLLFHITFFTFLLSRPLIKALNHKRWWYIDGVYDAKFALSAIIISLLSLFLGAFIVECILGTVRQYESKQKKYQEIFSNILQNVALVVFIIAYIFCCIEELEKLSFMSGKDYLEYYTSFQSVLPCIVHTLASFMKYALCIFLATLPSKIKCFFPLLLFWLSGIPDLIIGMRNPIMLNSVFIFVYYCYRMYINQEEKWIGKCEKGLLAIGIPSALIFMGKYSQIRGGETVIKTGIMQSIIDFFYGQGVTFDVLMIGYRSLPYLPHDEWGSYTFSGIIDYILYGSIGQKIFHLGTLPSGNNIINATIGHNFSHNMSYIALGEEYLKGKGWGSSYLLELYADFGYMGVAIFSLILGAILLKCFGVFKHSLLGKVFMFNILLTIFFIPRAEATGWLNFIVTLQFWVCLLGCWMLSKICIKGYYIFKRESMN